MNKNKNNLRFFSQVIYFLITLIFIFLSLFAFYLSYTDSCTCCFFTSFLKNLNKYGNILTITIALITVAFILNQIKEARTSNKNTIRLKWEEIMENFLSGNNVSNQSMKIHFANFYSDIFDFLYDINPSTLRINNIAELKWFYEKFVKQKINDFELFSLGYNADNKKLEPYSITEITKIIEKILKPSSSYPSLIKDFQNLYLTDFKKLS